MYQEVEIKNFEFRIFDKSILNFKFLVNFVRIYLEIYQEVEIRNFEFRIFNKSISNFEFLVNFVRIYLEIYQVRNFEIFDKCGSIYESSNLMRSRHFYREFNYQ